MDIYTNLQIFLYRNSKNKNGNTHESMVQCRTYEQLQLLSDNAFNMKDIYSKYLNKSSISD